MGPLEASRAVCISPPRRLQRLREGREQRIHKALHGVGTVERRRRHRSCINAQNFHSNCYEQATRREQESSFSVLIHAWLSWLTSKKQRPDKFGKMRYSRERGLMIPVSSPPNACAISLLSGLAASLPSFLLLSESAKSTSSREKKRNCSISWYASTAPSVQIPKERRKKAQYLRTVHLKYSTPSSVSKWLTPRNGPMKS